MKKPTKKPTKKSYTVTEAAQRLGVSRAAVNQAIKTGRLEATKGKIVKEIVRTQTITGWLIDPKELEAYRVSALHQQAGKKN